MAVETHADEAVGAVGFDGRLLGVEAVENFEDFDVVALEGEVDEVGRIGVDEVLGNGIQIGHSYLGRRRK